MPYSSHIMPNVSGACFGNYHALVESAIECSKYDFITVEEIVVQTNMRLLDVQYALADMRDKKMVTVQNNCVAFTALMRKTKKSTVHFDC